MSTRAMHPLAWFPAVVGVLLSLVHARHILFAESTIMFALASIPFSASLILVSGGILFAMRAPDSETVARVVIWLVVGAVGALVVGAWTTIHVFATHDAVDHLSFVLAGNITGGVLLGSLLGIYDGRARKRQAQVETTRAKARLERDRFAALFDNVHNPVVFYDFRGGDPVFRTVNGAFERVFGYDADEVRDRRISDVVVPPGTDPENDVIDEHIREGTAVQRELRRQTAYGARDFLISVIPVESDGDHSPSGFFIAIDITERTRRDRRLQVLNRVLRHDLRNAMNVILGYVEFISDDPETAREVISQRANEMVELSETARSVEEALDVAEDATHVSVDVVPHLRDTLDAKASQHDSLTVRTGTFPDAAVARLRDPKLFTTAVENVVDNVVEHTDRDGATLTVDLSVTDAFVVVRFTDDGPGIPEHELDVLASERETKLEHLSGLGLWLVNWIIEDSDGNVDFENVDDGAVVTFRLQRVAG